MKIVYVWLEMIKKIDLTDDGDNTESNTDKTARKVILAMSLIYLKEKVGITFESSHCATLFQGLVIKNSGYRICHEYNAIKIHFPTKEK